VAGFLTYVAVFTMTVIWILGWMGLCVVVGSFFELSLKSVSLVGATLGPLGLMVTIMLGILESSRRRGEDGVSRNIPMTVVAPVDDPFA
jgi:hypothetical protein